MVIWLAFGTQGNQRSIVSLSFSLSSATSCMIKVPVKVLVIEPIRVWSATVGASLAPLRVVPRVAIQP